MIILNVLMYFKRYKSAHCFMIQLVKFAILTSQQWCFIPIIILFKSDQRLHKAEVFLSNRTGKLMHESEPLYNVKPSENLHIVIGWFFKLKVIAIFKHHYHFQL
jgi:hypothetical protein